MFNTEFYDTNLFSNNFFWEMQIRIIFAFSVIGLEISGKKKTFDFDYLVQIIWCIRQMASKTFLVQRFWVPLVIGSWLLVWRCPRKFGAIVCVGWVEDVMNPCVESVPDKVMNHRGWLWLWFRSVLRCQSSLTKWAPIVPSFPLISFSLFSFCPSS